MKLTKRERVFVIVGFVAVALIAYVFYFAMPQITRQSTLASQILTSNSTLQTLKAKSLALDNLKQQAVTLQNDIDGQSQNIPHGSNDAITLVYLRQLADRTGLDIAVTFTKDDAQDGAFTQRLVAVEFKSSYAKMSRFLDELAKEELANKVRIISATYEPAQAGQETGIPVEPSAPVTIPVSIDTVKAHIELTFQSFKLMDGEAPSAPPLPANVKERAANLFPD